MKKSLFVFALAMMALSFIQCTSDDDTSSECICPKMFDPVCGEDGQLYGSACEAECAGVEYIEGHCPEERNGVIFDTDGIAADGCGWVIQFLFSDYLIDFKPTNLSDDFKIDGQEITVNYTLLEEFDTCDFGGEIQLIEINAITVR